MAQQDLDVKIGAQFVGGKAFDDAKKKIGGLEGAAGALGKKLTAAFSAYAVANYAKKSIEAFAKDEAAAKALEIQLRNTGNAFAITDVEYFISKTQKLTGVLDDQLRPAFQTLLTASMSVIDSQKALSVALDISAATGRSVEEVSAALAKGYTGQTTAIQRLGVGISQATLDSKDMNKVLAELQQKFSGQAAARLDTFAGKMDLLKVASANVAEIIGQNLVESLNLLANGKDGIDQLTTSMEDFATKIGDAIYGLAVLLDKLAQIPVVGGLLKDFMKNPLGLIPVVGTYLQALSEYGASKKAQASASKSNFTYSLGTGASKEISASKQAKIEKDRLAAISKQNKLLADQNKTKKASSLFDIDQIQILAALQNKITDNEKLRLQLQMALLQGNVEEADRLSNELAKSQLLTTNLAFAISNLPPALNPFKNFPDYINDILKRLMELQRAMDALKMPDVKMPSTSQTSAAVSNLFASLGADVSQVAGGMLTTGVFNGIMDIIKPENNPNFATSYAGSQVGLALGFTPANPTPIEITVMLDGDVVSTAVTTAQLDKSASGSFATIGNNGRTRNY